jgi:hypothetical protein
MSAPTDPEKLAAAIQELESERQRRIDDKIERGEAVRVTLPPVVLGASDSLAAAIERQKARKLAELRAAGEKREVVFAAAADDDGDPIAAIVTGVPRHSEFGQWRHEVL